MGKKQKSISIPVDFWSELEKMYEENNEDLKMLEVTSPSELMRVLANLGKTLLPQVLEQVRKVRLKEG